MNYPALELVWTPTGRPCVVHGRTWKIGEATPLGANGLSFGIEGDVRLSYPAVGKVCQIDQYGGRPRLMHLGNHHCAVNGHERKGIEVALQHRDLIAPPRGPVFRLLEREVISARSPGLEAALDAAPFDPELMHVWRDFLLDQGDPLGERLARWKVGGGWDDATWLDVFAQHYDIGALQIEWNGGMAVKAVLRESSSMFNKLESAVEHLLGLRVMRFLQDLVIDVSSDRLNAPTAIEALRKIEWPKTLQRLSLGDVPDTDREKVEQATKTPWRPFEIGYYSGAQLNILRSSPEMQLSEEPIIVGNAIELGRTAYAAFHSQHVLIAQSYIVARDAARYVLARLISTSRAAKVNGKPVDKFPLRDGDLVELGDDLTAVFKLLR